MYSAKRIKRKALLCYVALLPIAFVVVVAVGDRAWPWYWWVLATIAVDILFGLLLGFFCMLLGFVYSIFDRDSDLANHLLGFGAALSLVYFQIFDIVAPGDPGAGEGDG